MDTLTAFTESGKTWTHAPSIRAGSRGERILSINYPVEYTLTTDFLQRLQEYRGGSLTIDMAGRNYGVTESVYIKCSDIIDFLEQQSLLPTPDDEEMAMLAEGADTYTM